MTGSSGELEAKSFRVSGRVQGVCYRMYTVDQARKLGLTGWVRNLPDGDVEVYACGPKAQIEALHQWLHEGPPRARVSKVTSADAPVENHADFSIRH